MTRWFSLLLVVVGWLLGASARGAPESGLTGEIDRATLDRWSAPYRGWHYWPDHVISAKPNIPGYEKFENTDVPCVYQLLDQSGKWFMSFIAFDGSGYNSFVAESTNLIHWSRARHAMGFGPAGEFNHGGLFARSGALDGTSRPTLSRGRTPERPGPSVRAQDIAAVATPH